MKCCPKCFQDKVIIDFIQTVGQDGDCDFCGAEDLYIIPAEDLGEKFDDLLDLYEPADEQKYHVDESLADKISGWEVFSDDLATEKQNAILDEIRFGPLDPKDRSITARSSERWQFKYAYWEEDIWENFAEHIKHSRRFILDDNSLYFSQPREWLPDILAASQMLVSPDMVFHRARLGCSNKSIRRAPFPADEMMPPPSEIARRGRANPAGISYFYAAVEAATAVAEIRPYVGAQVSVCSLHSKRQLKIADITRIHKIESPFGQPDLKAQVQRNGLLKVLNRELARPINPDDSEIEYVPTQYLAEAILEIGYDGIRYKSAVRKGGTNFVFFEPDDLTINPQTRLVEVDSIDVKYQGVPTIHFSKTDED